ncbi:hypothetical protein PR048_011881 [Dryococelus australis]|uniref:Polyprotein n=1 Tax=Dryococelus australis TaxID=614101 RepID=A0ABQ9HP45_9NEOP|nr:hypothetical protein PR048_011881 [Dryococelus australis]
MAAISPGPLLLAPVPEPTKLHYLLTELSATHLIVPYLFDNLATRETKIVNEVTYLFLLRNCKELFAKTQCMTTEEFQPVVINSLATIAPAMLGRISHGFRRRMSRCYEHGVVHTDPVDFGNFRVSVAENGLCLLEKTHFRRPKQITAVINKKYNLDVIPCVRQPKKSLVKRLYFDTNAAGVDNGSKTCEQGNFAFDKSVPSTTIHADANQAKDSMRGFISAEESSEGDASDDSDINPDYALDDGQNKASSLDSDFSDSEVNTDCATAVHKIRGTRGRLREVRNSKRRKRNAGQSYVTESGKKIRARSFRRLSHCRVKCELKVNQENQQELFQQYWRMGTRDRRASYLADLMTYTKPNQKQKSPGTSTTPDKRGRHEPPNKTNKAKLDKVNEFLNALPTYERHYCRKESSKKYLPPHLTISELHKKYCEVEDKRVSYTIFSKLFSEANIAIKNPKENTCRICDELKMNLIYAGNDEQMSLKQQQDMRHSVAELDYQLHVFCGTNRWQEEGRIAIASCVCRAILNLPEKIKDIVMYSDSCPGQNKNTPVLAMCLYVVQEKKIDMLDHKFMVPGHSRMECDSDHAVIKKWQQVRWLHYVPDKPKKVLYKTSLK